MKLKKGFLEALYISPQSVFSSKEVAILTGENDPLSLKSKLSYYVRVEKLKRLRKGFYAKSDEYDKKELATKLYTPSYVSFETVLAKEGVIFQYYDTIFCAGYLSREVQVGDICIRYRKLKNEILLNRAGLIEKDFYFEASRERAFLDMIYINSECYFDNLRSLDWEKCESLVSLYKNASLIKVLNEYKKKYAQ